MSERSPEIRASDAERDRVGGMLREHFAQGRLDAEEFEERLERAYSARTVGELERLTTDLPEHDLRRPSVSDSYAHRPVAHPLANPAIVMPWVAWAGASALNFLIWLILVVSGGGDVYPWWVWVAGPWGVVLLLITITTLVTGRGTRPR